MSTKFIQRGLFERINKECINGDLSKQRVAIPRNCTDLLYDNSKNRTIYVCRFHRDEFSDVFVFDGSKYSDPESVLMQTCYSWDPNVVNSDYMPGKRINLKLIIHMCEDLGYTIKYYMPDWVISPAVYEQLEYKKQALKKSGSDDPIELEKVTKQLIEKERVTEMLNKVVEKMKKKVDDATPKPNWASMFSWWQR